MPCPYTPRYNVVPHLNGNRYIYQPKLSEQLTTIITPNLLRIVGVVLAIGLTLAVVTYLYTQSQSRKQPSNQQNLPNSNQRI